MLMNNASGRLGIGFGATGAGLAVLVGTAVLLSLQVPSIGADPGNSLKPTPAPSLTISSDNLRPALQLTPNNFDGDSSTITTTTDNPTGYATTISTNSPTETCLRRPSDATACAAAVKPINPVGGTISPTGAISPSALNINQWGVSLATNFSADPSLDSAWFAVPSNASPGIIESSPSATPDTGDSQTLTIGAKVDRTIPATATGDEYQNIIVLTATANALAPATITSLTTDNPGNNHAAQVGNFATAGLSGGDNLTIVGTGLDTAFEVAIGGVALNSADCSIDSETQISCATPAKAAGTYDVVVKTWGSPNGVAASQQITYVASPVAVIEAPFPNQTLDYDTQQTDLIVGTNGYATCHYGDTADPTTPMSTTNTSGNAAHQQLIDGLSNGGSYTRYVRCNYPNSPPSATVSVTFQVDATAPEQPTLYPLENAIMLEGTMNITVRLSGYICHWGDSPTSMTNENNENYEIAIGLNTLYYICVNSAGHTRTGDWSFTGMLFNMSSFNQTECEKLAINEIRELNDARTNQIFRIIRLKMSPDGSNDRCWMKEGLSIGGITLTPADSDVAVDYWVNPISTWATAAGGPPRTYLPTSGAIRTDIAMASPLYNWASAVAYSTAQYGPGAKSDSQDVTGTAQYSICPKGWRLPIGGSDITTNEFALVDIHSYGGTGASRVSSASRIRWTAANGFAMTYTGAFNGSTFYDQGASSFAWTATSHPTGPTSVYAMFVNALNTVNPQTSVQKFVGAQVRCVVR